MPVVYGITNAPSTTSFGDGTNNPLLAGKAGEVLNANLHGKWYSAAYRSRVFAAPTLIAGVTIPVNTTTAATYALYNPLGSGVVVELISLDVVSLNGGTIGSLLISVATQTPTSVTGLTPISIPIGAGGTAAAKVYTAATITAITTHIPLGQVQSTTGATPTPHYEFDGKIVVAPGGLVNLVSNPVQTVTAIPCFIWAEWPV